MVTVFWKINFKVLETIFKIKNVRNIIFISNKKQSYKLSVQLKDNHRDNYKNPNKVG